jgi:alpha-D-ribose 1-methylphosphonate 5-triphosphate diphosphatase
MLMEQHDLGVADVWPLISSNAADAALILDRGVISNHKRADIIFIDDSNPKLPEVTKSFIGGKLVYSLNRS